MERLGVYCFYDKSNDIYFGFSTSYNDEVGSKFLVDETLKVIDDLKDDKSNLDLFISNMSSCDILRLGYIDVETGQLLSDKSLLSTFQGFDFKKVIKEKNENDSEVDVNV